MELMEGLTVLSTGTQNGVGAKIVLMVLGIVAGALAIACFVLAIISFSSDTPDLGILMIVYTVACVVASIVAISGAAEDAKTTYKVTIDENVSFTEFSERYEIIDQDGLIYEIVKKGDEG